jgi:hypothetical protein
MTIVNKRSVYNVGNVKYLYAFINMFLSGPQFGPSGTGGFTGAAPFAAVLGSNGLPNTSIAAGSHTWGSGIEIPSSLVYGDVGSGQYYVVSFKGAGQFTFPSGGITAQLGMSTNVTAVSGSTWRTTTSTVDSYFVFNYTGPAQQITFYFQSNDPDGAGATGNVRQVRFYRKDDETDLLAGKIFRTTFKQHVLNNQPSIIRFMDWHGGTIAKQTRYSTTRSLPTLENFTQNWTCSPVYLATSGVNQMTLAASAGTVGNPQTTPATMVHGEVVLCTIGAGMARPGATSGITGITKAASGVVTFTGHGFLSGDQVIFNVPAGMVELDSKVATVTVIDANSFSININTTGFSTFSGSAGALAWITLNVGGRGSYPVSFQSPAMASIFGAGYIATNDIKTFIFDKSIAMSKDSGGNWTYGTWIFNDGGTPNPHDGGYPIEIMTQLINELNAMSPKYPIDMWINLPSQGVSSMDNYTTAPPFAYTSSAGDYTAAANYGVGMVASIMNGGSGFAGLAAPARLFIEYSNETWNSAGGFNATQYLARRSFHRWPSQGTTNYGDMPTLRSVVAFEDIKASAAYNASRVKFIMAGQGTLGVSGVNVSRIDGTTTLKTDLLYSWGDAPANHYDAFGWGAYWTPDSGWVSTNLPPAASSWVSHNGNASAQETDCANYVLNAVQVASGSNTETMDNYATKRSAYATKMASYSKDTIMYEGGWDQNITNIAGGFSGYLSQPYCYGAMTSGSNQITGCDTGYVSACATAIGSDTVFAYGYGIPSGTTVTAASGSTVTLSKNCTQTLATSEWLAFASQQAFLWACKNSRAMANAQKGFFDGFNSLSNAGFPSLYEQIGTRWGYTVATAHGFSRTEWGDMDLTWKLTSLRNNDKREFLLVAA